MKKKQKTDKDGSISEGNDLTIRELRNAFVKKLLNTLGIYIFLKQFR